MPPGAWKNYQFQFTGPDTAYLIRITWPSQTVTDLGYLSIVYHNFSEVSVPNFYFGTTILSSNTTMVSCIIDKATQQEYYSDLVSRGVNVTATSPLAVHFGIYNMQTSYREFRIMVKRLMESGSQDQYTLNMVFLLVACTVCVVCLIPFLISLYLRLHQKSGGRAR